MATSDYDALALEIDRITASPYPSQLRALHDIAVLRRSADEIGRWATSKPCLIEALVSCLLDALPLWPYVWDIVTAFASDQSCRDALLRHEPTLLQDALSLAVDTERPSRQRYVAAAVALLSIPLPVALALPADAQNLFVQLVDEAATTPSATSVERVYFLLAGVGGLLLAVLDDEVLTRFEEQLLRILRAASEAATRQSVSLYCLAIMHVVCSTTANDTNSHLTDGIGSGNGSGSGSYSSKDFFASIPSPRCRRHYELQNFFTGSKAQRSLQLIALSALWPTSRSSSAEPMRDKIRALVLANEIVLAVPPDLRAVWCAANPATLRKLQDNACTELLDDTLRILALRFLGKLCDLDILSPPVWKGLQRTFFEPDSARVANALCRCVNDSKLFASLLSRVSPGLLVQNVVDLDVRADAADFSAALAAGVESVRVALEIGREHSFDAFNPQASLVQEELMSGLKRLRDMVRAPPERDRDSSGSAMCSTALYRMRCDLASDLAELFLRASRSRTLSADAMGLLLSLHGSRSTRDDGSILCAHHRHHPQQERQDSARQALEPPADATDWKQALQTHLRRKAQGEHDALVRLFSRACADLETRCEAAESPLREAQEKCSALESHNSSLLLQIHTVETRNEEILLQLSSLEKSHKESVCDLQLETSRLRSDLQTARTVSDLHSAALAASHQESLERLHEALARATSERDDLSAALAAAKKRLRGCSARVREADALRATLLAAARKNQTLKEDGSNDPSLLDEDEEEERDRADLENEEKRSPAPKRIGIREAESEVHALERKDGKSSMAEKRSSLPALSSASAAPVATPSLMRKRRTLRMISGNGSVKPRQDRRSSDMDANTGIGKFGGRRRAIGLGEDENSPGDGIESSLGRMMQGSCED